MGTRNLRTRDDSFIAPIKDFAKENINSIWFFTGCLVHHVSLTGKLTKKAEDTFWKSQKKLYDTRTL